jgi:hypothetical protein
MGYDRIAVVYMNTSDLCALTAASVSVKVKDLEINNRARTTA